MSLWLGNLSVLEMAADRGSSLQNASLCTDVSPPSEKKGGEVTSSLLPIFFLREGGGGWGVCTEATKMPSFSIASCSNGAEIHSMELLYFRDKRTGLAKKLGL